MIQDIAPHIYHNEYHPAPPAPEDYILFYNKDQILLRLEEERFTLPRFRELKDHTKMLSAQYLFSIDHSGFYLLPDLAPQSLPDYRLMDLKVLRSVSPQYLAFAGVTGFQLHSWYQKRRFCSCCQSPLVHSDRERMLYCPNCGNMEYPALAPAVIVAITHQDKLLLSKYEGRSYTRHALIAGYAEIGETIEETVHREVMEEVGLRVKNLRYYKSQPWSFSGSLLFGFVCDLDGDDTITLDRQELSMAKWFSREEIPDEGKDISLTKEMMMAFKKGLL